MEQIRKVNEYSMIKADAFANATLVDGREKITSWFDDFSLIDFTRPFFRTTTGKDTYFVIDSEIISANISRELSLKIILEFWENWKEKNQDYNFFWKILPTCTIRIFYVTKHNNYKKISNNFTIHTYLLVPSFILNLSVQFFQVFYSNKIYHLYWKV